MKNFKGTIIEESLKDKTIFGDLKILKTEIEKVTKEHNTPLLSLWTIHTFEIPENKASKIAEELSRSLSTENGNWYVDFKNPDTHYIIFENKVFAVNRRNAQEYEEAKNYGISLGIPDYQLDFSPEIKD